MITPIFYPQVKKLKEEPDENRDKGREKKIRCGFRERRTPSSPEIHTIHDKNERPPGKAVKPSLHERKLENKEKCG